MQKILLILESEDLCLALRDTLEPDCVVLVASDATVGVELLPEHPDALILDLILPGMDGLDFLYNNRSSLPPVILALTRFVDPKVLQIADTLGVNHILMKPCSVSSIMRKLRSTL